MIRRRTSSRLTSLLSIIAVTALAGLSPLLTGNASATQSVKNASKGYYVTSASTTAMGTIGCNQGTDDQVNGYTSRLAVLDFGAQLSDGSGTTLTSGQNVTTAQIKALAEAYASNWYTCTTTNYTVFNSIVIGTNNSRGSAITSANGTAWANMVDGLNAWVRSQVGLPNQLSFHGGNDMEPGGTTWGGLNNGPATVNWSNAYNHDSFGGFMYDFGSADGCPTSTHTNGSCNNGWNQAKEYNVSYQTTDALPLPEIYSHALSQQWTQISWYAHTVGSYSIVGPISENGPDPSTFTATQAWNDLWNELNSHSTTSQNLSENATINWQGQ